MEVHANPRKTIKIIHSISLLVIYNHWMKYIKKALPLVPPLHLFLTGLIYRLRSPRKENEVAKAKKKPSRALRLHVCLLSLRKKNNLQRRENEQQRSFPRSPLYLFQVSFPNLSMVLAPRGSCFIFPMRPLFCADLLIQRHLSLIKRSHYDLWCTVS